MISSSLAIGIPAATCWTVAEAKFFTLVRKLGESMRVRSGAGENPHSLIRPTTDDVCPHTTHWPFS
jgi:hypothetical protein